ncbi:hypothetical protein FQA47_008495 [Oryzias melastigma]|uniref:Uncharacterized protein n=1 Tax=Oryzias melastigma TaxID=30732 RepID=A0A834FDY9_ORYME|nr:hypothetical protein FQA47_008495 [Oryzias melastigma]
MEMDDWTLTTALKQFKRMAFIPAQRTNSSPSYKYYFNVSFNVIHTIKQRNKDGGASITSSSSSCSICPDGTVSPSGAATLSYQLLKMQGCFKEVARMKKSICFRLHSKL